MKKIYFVTGNKNKTEIFNELMQPEFLVDCFNPEIEIEELESLSVKEVVVDKLDKAYKQFINLDGFLFVTDVGLYMNQIEGRPGALIKRETKSLFDGDFKKWCGYLCSSKDRSAYIQMIIAAKDNFLNNILIDHKVSGYISEEPLPGEYGFAWDEIFVPHEDLVPEEHRGKSFAQIPSEIKFNILMKPAINQFKDKLVEN